MTLTTWLQTTILEKRGFNIKRLVSLIEETHRTETSSPVKNLMGIKEQDSSETGSVIDIMY